MTAHNVPGSADERQVADTVRDQRQAEAAQRSVERFRQTAAELRTQAQSFDDLATEWEKRVAFYSEQIDGQADG